MVSRLRPVDVTVAFEDRAYRLGESVGLEIEMKPRRDCLVREGRVDLVLEQRWTERSTRTVEEPIYQDTGSGTSLGGGRIQIGVNVSVKETVRNFKEKSTPASAIFLRDAELRSSRPLRHRLELDIGADDPPRREAKTRWWVQTVVDVAGARDIKPRRKIQVSW